MPLLSTVGTTWKMFWLQTEQRIARMTIGAWFQIDNPPGTLGDLRWEWERARLGSFCLEQHDLSGRLRRHLGRSLPLNWPAYSKWQPAEWSQAISTRDR